MKDLSDGPLTGIRIVDLTTVVMGPYATSILGDMGADIIKVEPPQGDSTRVYKPTRIYGLSGIFLNINRNKRSIAMDLKRLEARSALANLIENADVFVHNLRPTVIQRMGFDYEAVKSINPNIIYCVATGFGAEGPYAEKPAYDDLIQAGSGFSDLFNAGHGVPAYAPSALCDKFVGQAIVYAVLGALLHRERGGGGQSVEVPMFETSIAFNMAEHYGAAAFVPPLGPAGYARLTIPERKPYKTLDGYICILPYSDKNWRDFFIYINRDDLLKDERYATLGRRAQVFNELYALIESEAKRRTNSQWLSFCEKLDIPCMPVIPLDEVHKDPHVRAVGLFQEMEHPQSGAYNVIRSPIRFSATPFKVRHHAPMLGQNSFDILKEIGMSQVEIDAALLLEKR